jgi:SNF2 family DNA or RNA helicase
MERYALYAWNSGGGADVVGMRPDTRDEAYRVLDPRFRRMLKAIVLPQLPPKVRQTQTAEMSPQQKRAYDELDARLWTRLPDGQLLIAQNQLVGKTRLMQFAAGTVKVDKPDPDDVASWKVTIGNPSPKLDLLEEVLDELGNDHPFLVSVVHRDVARLAAERLAKRGIRHALIMGGEVTPEQAVQYTEDQKAGNLHALVFTVSMGGEGLDMSGADTLIRVQRSWSLIQNLQVEDRCHRIGSERYDSINVIDLVTADTIEEKQVAKLLDKLEQLDEITRDRAVLAAKLAETPHWSEDYGQLVAKMIALTQRQQDLLQHDELDIWPKEAA